MSYSTDRFFDYRDEELMEYGEGDCHSAVQSAATFFAIRLKRPQATESELERIEKYLKFLETMKIYASVNKNFHGKIVLYFDVTKTEVKFDCRKKRLFAYEITRYCLNHPSFTDRVMEIHEKLDVLTAWECIYLAWNEKPISLDEGWQPYFDIFPGGKSFDYISLTKTLLGIDHYNLINDVFTYREELKSPIKIDDIKNSRLSNQFENNLVFGESVKGFYIQTSDNNVAKISRNIIFENKQNKFHFEYDRKNMTATVSFEEAKKIKTLIDNFYDRKDGSSERSTSDSCFRIIEEWFGKSWID